MRLTKGLRHRAAHLRVWPFFVGMRGKSFIHGRLRHTGALYAPGFERHGNGIRTVLKCDLIEGQQMGENGDFLRGGYSGGYSNWIFIFEKLDIQNSCQAPPRRIVASEQLRGGMCRKLTLCEHLLSTLILAQIPINTGIGGC